MTTRPPGKPVKPAPFGGAERDRSMTMRNPEREGPLPVAKPPREKEPPLTLYPLDLETALGAALKAGPYRPEKKPKPQ